MRLGGQVVGVDDQAAPKRYFVQGLRIGAVKG
jgi:hypothetical protein